MGKLRRLKEEERKKEDSLLFFKVSINYFFSLSCSLRFGAVINIWGCGPPAGTG